MLASFDIETTPIKSGETYKNSKEFLSRAFDNLKRTIKSNKKINYKGKEKRGMSDVSKF